MDSLPDFLIHGAPLTGASRPPRAPLKSKKAVANCFFFSSFLSPCSIYFFFPFPFLSFFFSSFVSGFCSSSQSNDCNFLMYVSKIQLDNVLPLTVNHTLIFVNVPTSANIRLHFIFLLKLFVFFCQKWIGAEGSILWPILCDARQSRQSFWANKSPMLMNSILKEIRFYLRKWVLLRSPRE